MMINPILQLKKSTHKRIRSWVRSQDSVLCEPLPILRAGPALSPRGRRKKRGEGQTMPQILCSIYAVWLYS